MNKYRIKHYYDVYLRKEVYMPQMKKWWGWENLLDGWFSSVAERATKTEKDAKMYIESYNYRLLCILKNDVEHTAKKQKIKTKIIEVNL